MYQWPVIPAAKNTNSPTFRLRMSAALRRQFLHLLKKPSAVLGCG